MPFTSISFLCFFITFFVLYWFIFNKSIKLQNTLLLLGSYIFYAWSDWRFLIFLICVSTLNFYLGIYIEKTKNQTHKQMLLYIGLIQGIGGLAFFKYYNFFIDSFNEIFQSINISPNLQTLNIIIPLGISFFTFRTISYLLDIDKGKIKPTKDIVIFLTYVSFFPSILSGPIDRPKDFILQLEKKRIFDYQYAVDGMRQILWGIFKKIVIADNCASITNTIFDNYQSLPASTLLLGAFLYTMQMYSDFSGYSDMAIGVSRLIGFNIAKNFDFPFFAQNIAEYWRKWHMSLTSWLTDYVFTPLCISFRAYGKYGLILAILINFTICGIWHGANWTFVLFGFLHGCYFIPLILFGKMNQKSKIAKGKLLPTFKEFSNVLITFTVVMLTFIVFRSESIEQAYHYYLNLFSLSIFNKPSLPSGMINTLTTFIFIFVMLIIEWVGKERDYAIANLELNWPLPVRWVTYYSIFFAIVYFAGSEQKFIYVQF